MPTHPDKTIPPSGRVMAGRIPAWAVYRRVPRSPEFEFVGLVLAKTWRDGLALAKRLPDAGKEPTIAHAMQRSGCVALASAEDLPAVEAGHRVRRRAA